LSAYADTYKEPNANKDANKNSYTNTIGYEHALLYANGDPDKDAYANANTRLFRIFVYRTDYWGD
jgi:hypothetical protein